MQLFDFRCSNCDHRFEDWDTSEASADVSCPKCDTPGAVRLISALRLDYLNMAVPLDGSDSGLTTAIDKWAKRREEKVKIEKRNLDRHGTYD
jgi:putative FmdB family regulatory protein